MPAMPHPEIPTPRPAATIILLREPDGSVHAGSARDGGAPEVLLMRRHARSGFAARAWVFPGGVVEATDADLPDHLWTGIDPASLEGHFSLGAHDILGLHVAAIRETFEEAGVMLASHRDGSPVDTGAPAVVTARAAANVRGATVDWAAFLEEHDLVLDLGAVTPFSRWITPVQEPRRYDTWFFVARLPEWSQASADDVEMTESRWVTPARALAGGDMEMIFPTIRTLERIAAGGAADAVLEAARTQGPITPVQPHILTDDEGNPTEIILPDDDRYPDLGGT
jgi:8-oxo-dGTP pyrophosphatase MutT (NUDIX family)